MGTFLHIKWHFAQRLFYVNLSFYFLFLVSLTSLTGIQTGMTNCGSNITSFCFAKETKCLNYTNFMEIVKKCDSDSSDSYLVGFWVFYGLTVTGVIFMAIREFVQV
jgi:hypothetical protein